MRPSQTLPYEPVVRPNTYCSFISLTPSVWNLLEQDESGEDGDDSPAAKKKRRRRRKARWPRFWRMFLVRWLGLDASTAFGRLID